MSDSIADVCNQALSSIGARGSITSLDEASKEAVTCKIHYESTRKPLLRSAHWGFARRQIALSELGNAVDQTAPTPWAFMYDYPADCIRLRYLVWPPQNTPSSVAPTTGEPLAYSPWFMPSRNNRFIVANTPAATGTMTCILSNVPNAIAVYTADIQDPGLWDSMFNDAMVASLAARLCMPMTGKVSLVTAFQTQAQQLINLARAADGNEALSSTDHTPDWITTRGLPAYGFNGGYPDLGMWYQGWDNTPWGM